MINFERIDCLIGEGDNPKEGSMVVFCGKIAGVDVWGECLQGDIDLNVGKFKGLQEHNAPKLWNYIKEMAENY